MTDANNMYLQGKAEDRSWQADGSSAGVTTAPNANTQPTIGHTIDIACQHRFARPNLDARLLRPVEFPSVSPTADRQALVRAVEWVDERVGWFHSIDLPHGITTPGGRGWEQRARVFDLGSRVDGKRVLDLGSMEGGDVFAAEDAGAASVTALDVDHYLQYDLGLNAAWDFVAEKHEAARADGPEAEWVFLNSKRFGFELCKAARGSPAKRITGSVYDLDPAVHGQFDVTMCFGLLYHLRHPLLALDRIAQVTKDVMLVNNQIFAGPTAEPNSVLFFNDTWRGSYTNWFVPGPDAFLGMLSSSGFRRLEVVDTHDTSISVACYK